MITDALRDELETMATEQPAPPTDRVTAGALAKARRIRGRRRAGLAALAVAGAIAVGFALPGTGPHLPRAPVASQGPAATSNSPTGAVTNGPEAGDGAAAASGVDLPRLRLTDCDGKVPGLCWVDPARLVVDGVTYVQVSSGSIPLRRGNRDLELTIGHGTPRPSEYRVLVGLAGPRSARLPGAVAYVDGRRALTVPEGGRPRLLGVHRGEHEVRIEAGGPGGPGSHLVIAEYHRRD